MANKMIAFYYGSSSSDVTTICTAGASGKMVDIIVLQNSPFNKPTYSSTVASMVSAAHAQNVKVFGYVDSGGANFSSYVQVPGYVSWNGSTCNSVSKYPTLHIANPSGESGYWCHRSYDTTDPNLSSPNYTNYYGECRKQVSSSTIGGTDSTCKGWWFGYLSEHVDLWLGSGSSQYKAEGIMWDNCYPGSPNSTNAPTTDSRYLWYKYICDQVRYSYSSALTMLNCGNYPSARWWFDNKTRGGTQPFFDFMNIAEEDYHQNGNSHFPPNTDSSLSPYPSWVQAGTYADYLCAICKLAGSINSADTQAWYNSLCSYGIKFGYVATGTYPDEGFGSVPFNFSTQYSDCAATSCSY